MSSGSHSQGQPTGPCSHQACRARVLTGPSRQSPSPQGRRPGQGSGEVLFTLKPLGPGRHPCQGCHQRLREARRSRSASPPLQPPRPLGWLRVRRHKLARLQCCHLHQTKFKLCSGRTFHKNLKPPNLLVFPSKTTCFMCFLN